MTIVKPAPLSLSSLEGVVDTIECEQARAKLWDQLAEERGLKEARINAFEQTTKQMPKRASGPFNGLPITVKDQIAVAGWPRWFGMERQPRKPDAQSAPFIRKLQDMGCVVQAKTALPPHALDLQTFNARRGPTQNPIKHGFTAGGSSGGGAAAVASGMSLLDIGTDLAGSLRLPASWCGVTSLIPTEGRFDNAGMLPKTNRIEHFARMGPIARSANDLRFFWKTLTGEDHLLSQSRKTSLKTWDQGHQAAMEKCVSTQWSKLGANLINENFDFEQDSMEALFSSETRQLFGEIMGFESAAMLPFFLRWLLRRDADAIMRSPHFLRHVYQGYRRDKRQHAKNLKLLQTLRQRALRQFENCDALVLPVSGVAAFPHVQPIKDRGGVRTYDKTFETKAGRMPYLDALTYFTVPVGILGWPIVTLPYATDENGLPIGLQLVGKPNEDAKLLSIACGLERTISDIKPVA